MRKAILGMICIFGVIGMTLSAQAFEVGARGYYWFPTLKGDMKVNGNGLTGTKLDLKSDLGFDDEYYPIIETFIGFGDHHLSLSYYRADYSGTEVLSSDIIFKLPFSMNDRINSSLEYDSYDLMYQYDLLDLENILAGFSLGIVGKVKLIDGKVEIKSTTRNIGASEDFTAPIPMLGVNFHVGIIADLVEAQVKVTGITYGDGSILDGQADISYTPLPFVDIHGGYRFFTIDMDVDDLGFNYNTSGPYIALTVSY